MLPATAQATTVAARTIRPPPKREDIIRPSDPANNVTDYIYQKIGVNLHHQPDHPIGIIKQAIYDYFDAKAPGVFAKLDVSEHEDHTVHACRATPCRAVHQPCLLAGPLPRRLHHGKL